MWACVLSPYKNILSERMHATVKKVLSLWVLITRSNYPSVMSMCNTKSWGITNFCQISMHTLTWHILMASMKILIHLLPQRGGWWGQQGTKQLCPEIAYFLSSHIAVVRETDRSVLTGQQFTTAHSDSDLSVLNTVAFSNGTWSW